MTAPLPLLEIIDLHTSNTNLQPSSTTQAIVIALLQHWGHDEFMQHTQRVAMFYKEKRDMFELAARKHLDGLASWVTPDCGMFLYLHLHLAPASTTGSGDSLDLIKHAAVAAGFLAVPGTSFMPSGSKSSCVRVSYSLASQEEAEEAFRRLRGVILDARGEGEKA